MALVGGDLPVVRVHRHLRLDGDGADHVAAGQVEALHLDVTQHLQDVAVVGLQQGRVDLAALVAQLAFHHPRRELEVPGWLAVLREQPLPFAARNQEERMVLHLAGEPRVDLLAFEVRVRLDRAGAQLLAEPDGPLHQPLVGEDPVEPVERALFLARVVLQRTLHGGDDGRFRRPVRPVQQDQLVHPAGAHEGMQHPVDGVLHFFLPDNRRSPLALLHSRRQVEGPVEQLEPADAPRSALHGLGAVVVEGIADVLRGVARVHARSFEERLHVLLEGEDGLVFEERTADLIADGL